MHRTTACRLLVSSRRATQAAIPPHPLLPNVLSNRLQIEGRLGHPALDIRILRALEEHRKYAKPFGKRIIFEYETNACKTLSMYLPYESAPDRSRRPLFDRVHEALVLVAHVLVDGSQHKIAVSSGFAVDVPAHDSSVVISCAHTLEEIRHSSIFKSSSSNGGTFVITSSMDVHPVSSILSSLPRSDLIAYSLHPCVSLAATLPVNPYPAPLETPTRCPLVSFESPEPNEKGNRRNDWLSWKDGVVNSRWVKGKILGYRDRAGREAQPGTYDHLSHMLFSTMPSPGSSGAPIIDEENGSVIGVITGHGMVNRIEGQRGFGTPAEAIYEMFSLPGLQQFSSKGH
ncbi:uncharacterized protein EI90DRAFT_3080647 [Cantharellus anzutake]|uniref:uncharacterized protein n=1 Tax=Cantharellus anzutake TaxID=1750568 RepID=UPI00190806FB|nr:uncharacterized protein EI90DRAFT_3080647 [Cantharellus anzutake]KAF8320568.1 hypothetical protein EI90DRAFT_3080647 [Cantharellus anzutake]